MYDIIYTLYSVYTNTNNQYMYISVVYRREKAKKLALERAGGVGDVEGAARAEVGQNYDPFSPFTYSLS